MAVTLTLEELKVRIQANLPDDRVQAMLDLATAAVLKWAPNAPDAAHNEAAIRYVGYLAHRSPSESESQIGEYRVKFTGGISPMLNSGAGAVLSQWYVPRIAGAT